ncbi:MAG: NrfD/PsrC family molybdoenzyme membrane anchor subunit [Bacillota bacterium]
MEMTHAAAWRRPEPVWTAQEAPLIDSITRPGPGFWAFVGALLAVVVWGLIAYGVQLRDGLGVTGLRNNVMWGVYITDFVFFIGVSHVGALMSAILRITGAEWRRPITRMAEAITFASLLMGAVQPLIDMGRPDRVLNLLLHGRLQSPILWDLISITTYLTGSTIFLLLPMIPDIAMLRDHLPDLPRWRRALYRILSFNWRGTPAQWERLERVIGIMALLIMPVAISVHTVVSWIFGMTLRAGWNSTIFGPYFVFGALFSGAAAVVTAMAVFRRVYRLDHYITEEHFRKMGYLVLALGLIYGYFTFAEYLTPAYKMAEAERGYLNSVLTGEFARLFWFTQIVGIALPVLLLTVPRIATLMVLRNIPLLRPRPLLTSGLAALLAYAVIHTQVPLATTHPFVHYVLARIAVVLLGLGVVSSLPYLHENPIHAAVIASVLVNIGAWTKRFVIIAPTLLNPFMPIQSVPAGWGIYRPTWVEWSITAAALAGFTLVYTLFSRLFPIISIWETREVRAHEVASLQFPAVEGQPAHEAPPA